MNSKEFFRSDHEGPADTDPIPTQNFGDDMASLTLALVVVCAVGLAVESTRWLGVLCLALLIVLHPVLFTLLAFAAGGAYLFIQSRRNR